MVVRVFYRSGALTSVCLDDVLIYLSGLEIRVNFANK